MDRLVWVGAFPSEDREDVRAIVAAALEVGFDEIVLERPDERLEKLGRFSPILLKDGAFLFDGAEIGRLATIREAKDEVAVRALKGATKHVVVRTEDWKVIPLENLIAALGGKTKLYAVAHSPQEAELFLTTLERGVDGIVARPKNLSDLRAYQDVMARRTPPKVKLVAATVTRVEALGLGERVCVDTTNLFDAGEGLLVGSGSHGFFLIAAETAESEYVAARPFRVNAGAIHSYVLTGEKTQYLSEVRAGHRLHAVRPNGERREVVVGRAKIETRPLLLVEAETETKKYNVILQNAETIRLTMPRGRTKSVADLRRGDRVLLHEETGARHFGMKVEERILER